MTLKPVRRAAVVVALAATLLVATATGTPSPAYAAADGPTVLAPPFASVETSSLTQGANGTVDSCVADASGTVDLEVSALPGSSAHCSATFAPVTFRVAHPGSRVDVVMNIAAADSPAPWWDGIGQRGAHLCTEHVAGDVDEMGCFPIRGVAGIPTAPVVTVSIPGLERGQHQIYLFVIASAGPSGQSPATHTSVRGSIASVTLVPAAK